MSAAKPDLNPVPREGVDSKEKQGARSVLLLALGDDFWTPFVRDFSELLASNGFTPVIATDSRVGEYQSYGGRTDYGAKTYYFTDYIAANSDREIPERADSGVELNAMFSDYYRLFAYGAHSHLRGICWATLKSRMEGFFREIFESEDISVVVHDQVSTSFSYVCYLIAREYGAPYLGLVGARVPERYEIRRSIYDEDEAVSSIYRELKDGTRPMADDERQWARDFLNTIDRQEPSYMQGNALNDARLGAYANRSKLTSLVRKLKHDIYERGRFEGLGFREGPIAGSLRSFGRNLRRLVEKARFSRYASRIGSDWLETHNYWVYPLHYQPEASTSVGSPEFVNQLEVLRNVAFNLPNNTYLVVKEHRSAIGFHPACFYRDVAALPNVILLDPNWNIKQLIRDSEGVITLTSTAGFEALLLGKRVVMFGNAFYRFHDLCTQVGSWHELRKVVRSPEPGSRMDSVDFLVSYRRYTRPGSIRYADKNWGIGEDLMDVIRQEPEIKRAKQ